MFKIFIIIFREILETAIILGLIAAATKNIPGRTKYIVTGVIIGIIGAIIVAFSTNAISELFDGYGQEIVNAGILLLASLTIIWTVIWMNYNKNKITAKLKSNTALILEKKLPLTSLIIITASSVFREGSEIVLFSYGIIVSTNDSILSLILGAVAGFIVASFIGAGVYASITRILGKYLFKITALMLSLIAAGMAAQAANFLSATDVITIYTEPLWDSSMLLSQNSVMGKILNVLIGYTENPSAIELTFYIGTLLLIFILTPNKNYQKIRH